MRLANAGFREGQCAYSYREASMTDVEQRNFPLRTDVKINSFFTLYKLIQNKLHVITMSIHYARVHCHARIMTTTNTSNILLGRK